MKSAQIPSLIFVREQNRDSPTLRKYQPRYFNENDKRDIGMKHDSDLRVPLAVLRGRERKTGIATSTVITNIATQQHKICESNQNKKIIIIVFDLNINQTDV